MFGNLLGKKKSPTDEIINAAREGRDEDIRKQLNKLSKEEAKKLIDQPNESKELALLVAAGSGHLKVINLLLEYGANLEVTGVFNETALHRAAGKKHAEVAKALLNAGIKLDPRSTDSQQAIHTAAESDAVEVIKVLLEQDPAQINWVAKEGRKPIFYAKDNETKQLLGQNNLSFKK